MTHVPVMERHIGETPGVCNAWALNFCALEFWEFQPRRWSHGKSKGHNGHTATARPPEVIAILRCSLSSAGNSCGKIALHNTPSLFEIWTLALGYGAMRC